MNELIANTEIKIRIKNLLKNKNPGPDGFTGEFYQTFRKELILIFLELFQINCRGRNTSKVILWGQNHPDTKARQRQHVKNISVQYHWWTERQNPQKEKKRKKNILANRIQPYIRKLMHHDQVRFILGYKNSSIYGNQSKWHIILINWNIKMIWSSQ